MVAHTLSSSMLDIGWLATIITNVLILILFGWMLVVRWLRLATDLRRQAMVRIWRPILSQSLIEDPASLPPIHPRDRVLFLYLWNHLQGSIKGESSEELCKVIRRTKMDEVVRHDLTHGTMRQQLLATVTLGYLKETSVWTRLVELAYVENAFLSFEAALALIRIDAPRAIPILVPLISQRTDWSPLKVLPLLQEVGEKHVSRALGEAALNASPLIAARLLRFLGNIRSHCALPLIRQLLARQPLHEDVLAAGIFLFGQCCDPQDLPAIRQYLEHPTWFIRLHAATALGKIGIEEDEERLIRLLGDAHWWVRYRAAEALSILPSMTKDKLTSLAQTLPTTEARTVLTPFVVKRFEDSLPSFPSVADA